ncbi:hypothetical protein TIFTF001_023663 [Ficus carica]|uniref:Uncharacterized protein n=1 Tax=Ficus carica TaxID=3494 RepID=A0AA88DK81_FICCA|nr:hypothetical protein TIFTF001_023663 [Ficus carica]
MDESWRMRMGSTPMSSLPRRRSTADQYSSNRPSVFADSEALEPEDFADVFGGPPRSVYWRKMYGDSSASSSSTSFYEEIFRPPEILHSCGEIGNRGLPAFRIPGTSDRFYRDVFRFGSDFSAAANADERRSRERSRPNSKAKSKSKSTSSSVLSSEEMSPLRPPIAEHVALSDFASKLRYFAVLPLP